MMDFGKRAEHFPDLRHILLFNLREESNAVGITVSCFHKEQEAGFLPTVTQLTRVRLSSSRVFSPSQGPLLPFHQKRLHFSRTVLPKGSWPSGPHF